MKAIFGGSSSRQGGFSQTPPSPQQQGFRPRQPLTEQILHTRYVNRADLQLFLEQKFPQQSDFAIRVHTFPPWSGPSIFSPSWGKKGTRRKRWFSRLWLILDKEQPLDIHGSGKDYWGWHSVSMPPFFFFYDCKYFQLVYFLLLFLGWWYPTARRLIGTIQTKLDRERASRRGVAHTW